VPRKKMSVEDVLGKVEDSPVIEAAETFVADVTKDVSDMVQRLEDKVAGLEIAFANQKDTIEELQTQNEKLVSDLRDANQANVTLHDEMRQLRMRPESVAPQNQPLETDPRCMVEVVELPAAGVMPIELCKPSYDGREILRYPPKFDVFGRGHFCVPRDYAEALLANNGGRKYVLAFPKRLTVRMPNGRHGFDTVTVEAAGDVTPIMQ
jgi:uncharacterized coiled-coil protein SlyX